jgi:hypothetical protein
MTLALKLVILGAALTGLLAGIWLTPELTATAKPVWRNLRGYVRDDRTARPIAGATVVLARRIPPRWFDDRYEVRTDGEGYFFMREKGTPGMLLAVRAPGYAEATIPDPGAMTMINLRRLP